MTNLSAALRRLVDTRVRNEGTVERCCVAQRFDKASKLFSAARCDAWRVGVVVVIVWLAVRRMPVVEPTA
eukprot:1248766-Pleurochrysis_carterae.AAC.1